MCPHNKVPKTAGKGGTLDEGPSCLGPPLADIKGGLFCTPEGLHQLVFPGKDVAQQWPGTVGDAQDLGRRQGMVPQVKLGDVTHEGLSGIKPAAQGILGQERRRERRETWSEAAEKTG